MVTVYALLDNKSLLEFAYWSFPSDAQGIDPDFFNTQLELLNKQYPQFNPRKVRVSLAELDLKATDKISKRASGRVRPSPLAPLPRPASWFLCCCRCSWQRLLTGACGRAGVFNDLCQNGDKNAQMMWPVLRLQY